MSTYNSNVTGTSHLQLALSQPTPLREQYLSQMFHNLFTGPDKNIHSLMVNCSASLTQHHTPQYSDNEDYERVAGLMQKRITSNLSLLKKHCMDLNWLDEYIQYYSSDCYSPTIDTNSC